MDSCILFLYNFEIFFGIQIIYKIYFIINYFLKCQFNWGLGIGDLKK